MGIPRGGKPNKLILTNTSRVKTECYATLRETFFLNIITNYHQVLPRNKQANGSLTKLLIIIIENTNTCKV